MISGDQSRPCFVADLIPLILELGQWWPRDLLSLATANSDWLYFVRRQLYAAPTLHTYPACSLLARTLQDNEHLCTLVKGLHLRPSRLTNSSGRSASKASADVRFLLSVLDGVTQVTLGGNLAIGAQRLLNTLSNPEIISYLHIDGSPDECIAVGSSLEWDDTLASKFRGLQTLKLAHIELEVVPPNSPLLEVVELVLDHVSVIGGSLKDMISPSSLRTVSVTSGGLNTRVEEELCLLLELSHVEDLRYEATWNKSHEPSFVLPHGVVTSLMRLALVGAHACPTLVQSFGRCFPCLRELVISGRASCITAEEWADTLMSSLPCLKKLGIPDGTCQPPYRKWCVMEESILAEQMASRDILLSISPF